MADHSVLDATPAALAGRLAVALEGGERLALRVTLVSRNVVVLVVVGGRLVHCVSGFLDVDAVFLRIARSPRLRWLELPVEHDYGEPVAHAKPLRQLLKRMAADRALDDWVSGVAIRPPQVEVERSRAPRPVVSSSSDTPSDRRADVASRPGSVSVRPASAVHATVVETSVSAGDVPALRCADRSPLPFRLVRRLATVSAVSVVLAALAFSVAGDYLPWELRALLDPRVHRVSGVLDGHYRVDHGETWWLRDTVELRSGRLVLSAGSSLRADAGATLIVGPQGHLSALGTRDRPVVFGSASRTVDARSGDWGGVVLEGRAPVRLDEGGVDVAADREHGCAVLHHVRIEHAGGLRGSRQSLDSESPFVGHAGLALIGCGRATRIDTVQVHASSGDGIAVVGGGFDPRKLLITDAVDDALALSGGYSGTLQHVLVRQGFGGGAAIHRSGVADDGPVHVWNATIVGTADDRFSRPGILLDGTGLSVFNTLLTGLSGPVLDVRGPLASALADQGAVQLRSVVVGGAGAGGHRYADDEYGPDDDDFGFDEAAFLADQDVVLQGTPALPSNAFDRSLPVWAPASGSEIARARALLPDGPGLDPTARYVGAFAPGSGRGWASRWSKAIAVPR